MSWWRRRREDSDETGAGAGDNDDDGADDGGAKPGEDQRGGAPAGDGGAANESPGRPVGGQLSDPEAVRGLVGRPAGGSVAPRARPSGVRPAQSSAPPRAPRRAPDGPLGEARMLLDRAVELAHRTGAEAEAERVGAEAVAAYRAAVEELGGGKDGPAARRGLALALWRQSMLLGSNGNTRAAIPLGQEGIRIGKALVAAADPADPELDALVGETATAMNDLSRSAELSGRDDLRQTLLREVESLCEGRSGPRARQALGTALHNEAVDVANRAVTPGQRRDEGSGLQAATAAATKAVEARRDLVDASTPMTIWELANSLLLRGKLRALSGAPEAAATDLGEAWTLALGIEGEPSARLRGELDEAMRMVEDTAPDVARSSGWPAREDRAAAPGVGEARASASRAARGTSTGVGAPGGAGPDLARTLAQAAQLHISGKSKQAINLLDPLVKAGEHEAMHLLSIIHRDRGKRRFADLWERNAAEAGNVDAMVRVGSQAALDGDVATATRHLSRAAESGEPNAVFNYGMLLVQYLGRTEDGVRLWERAAAAGHALAALNLGNVSHQLGRLDAAERWFRRGAALGNAQSMFNLAMMLAGSGRAEEAAHWHQQGLIAERG